MPDVREGDRAVIQEMGDLDGRGAGAGFRTVIGRAEIVGESLEKGAHPFGIAPKKDDGLRTVF